MRLPRPYVPLSIRLQVAAQQARELWALEPAQIKEILGYRWTLSAKLEALLVFTFANKPVELDHEPALAHRAFNPRTGKYTPDANDPAYLVWRLANDHYRKTYQRGDGARRSDASQSRYLKRIEAKRKAKHKFKPRPAKHIRRTHASLTAGHDHETK